MKEKTMDSGNKWIYFSEQRPTPGRKTKVVNVRSVRGDSLLGTIKWFGRWRQYGFYPADGTIYSDTCLDAIKSAVYRLNLERKGDK